MILTRTEKLRIFLELDKSQCDKFIKEIESLGKHPNLVINQGDRYKITYDFWIEYFGNTVKNFRSIRKILSDPKVVRQISVEELYHGESIIVELLDEIRKVQASL